MLVAEAFVQNDEVSVEVVFACIPWSRYTTLTFLGHVKSSSSGHMTI